MMIPLGSKRESGDWSPELEALQRNPEMMLLAAVYLRAKTDARKSDQARRFLRRVHRYYEEVGDPGYAVLMAMGFGRRHAGGGRGGCGRRWEDERPGGEGAEGAVEEVAREEARA